MSLNYSSRLSLTLKLSKRSYIVFINVNFVIFGTGRNFTLRPNTIFPCEERLQVHLLCISMFVIFLNLLVN